MTGAARRSYTAFVRRLLNVLAVAWLLVPISASATTVFLNSVGFSDVQMVVNGREVRMLRIGETSPEGVRLIEINNGVALLLIDGRQVQMRAGYATVTQTVLQGDSRGHFLTTASINGQPMRAMIDTGSTHVSISAAVATRLGIDYARGQQAISRTANGQITVYLVNLAHVQVGDIAFSNVTGSVRPDNSEMVLIGMSFLNNVETRQVGNTMTLQRTDR